MTNEPPPSHDPLALRLIMYVITKAHPRVNDPPCTGAVRGHIIKSSAEKGEGTGGRVKETMGVGYGRWWYIDVLAISRCLWRLLGED